jgi:hypothetical protein
MSSRRKKRKNGSKRKAPPPVVRLDAEAQKRREVLEEMERMSTDELVELAVRAGILDENHKLTAPYRGDEPSACRPTD